MYMFLFADACVSKAPVTLVTGLGGCTNKCFRKVWFYQIKQLLLLANVSKTPGVESAFVPTVAKIVPKGAQDLQNVPHLVEKLI